MFGTIKAFKEKGVLAINRRNADYTLRYNPRRLYPLVDDKLRTKHLAQANGIAVPDLYAVVEVAGQVHGLPETLRERSDFVIKPAHGSGGEGILVITERSNERLRRADGRIMSWEELNHYLFNVLSGLYSLGGQPDQALIEYRVKFDPIFEKISYQGVPDIRIILLMGVPVMSMVRLPTRMSDGKANLHQGAIGAGIDIATGTTLAAVLGNDIVTDHPDTGHPVTGLTIPHWDDLLKLAARCFELTGLGYQGVDIVLDRDRGPLILELNARPGLNIQIANNAGLLLRLELVEQCHAELHTVDQRVAFAKDHFGASGNPWGEAG
jgi:alpha-L-glutamate ligase-like protein